MIRRLLLAALLLFAPSSAWAAITLVGSSTAVGAGGTGDVTVTLPGGVAQNDVCYAGFDSSATSDLNITESTGTWTELADLFQNDTTDSNFAVYRKVQTATPDTSVLMQTSGTQDPVGVVICLRGADTTTPEDAASVTGGAIDSGTPNPGSITTVTNGAWVLPFAGSSEADAVTNPPTNYTNLADQQNTNQNIMVSTREICTAGAEDPPTYADIVGTTADTWNSLTVAVRPVSGCAAGTKTRRTLMGVGS